MPAPLRRHKNAVSFVILALIVLVLVWQAMRMRSDASDDVALHDASVWVTNTSPDARRDGTTDKLFGRMNTEIGEIDHTQSMKGAPTIRLTQLAGSVLVATGDGPASMRAVDPATGVVADAAPEYPEGAKVDMAAGRAAILDPESRKGWVVATDDLAEWSVERGALDMPADEVVVGADGTAYFVRTNAGGEGGGAGWVQAVSLDAHGKPQVAAERLDLPDGIDEDATLAFTVSGDTPAVLAWQEARGTDDSNDARRARPQLLRPGLDAVDVDVESGGDVRLQVPSSSGEYLYVATPTALLRIPVDGGSTLEQVHELGGTPATGVSAPVVVDGCVHVAWSVDDPTRNAFARLADARDARDDATCPHAGPMPVPGATGASIDLRTNGTDVVLNADDGTLWIVREDSIEGPINDWKQDEDATVEKQDEQIECDANESPTARDDELRIRPDVASIYPVLDNDEDPNRCDVLTISKVKPVGRAIGRAHVVGNGTQIQFEVDGRRASANGNRARFQYFVTDGADNGASGQWGTVTLRIAKPSDNEQPERLGAATPPRTVRVLAGATTTVDVLREWMDRDGDALVVRSVTASGGSRSARPLVVARPDGMITFTDTARTAGTYTVKYEVSDVRAGVAPVPGAFDVEVKPAGTSVPPVVVRDHAEVAAGEAVVIEPLENDASRDGTPLRLVRPPKLLEDRAFTPRLDETGTRVLVTAPQVEGSYLMEYRGQTSTGEATSWIRLDVRAPTRSGDPIAVRDTGILSASGTATIDLLANDVDPNRDELAVTGIDLDDDVRGTAKVALLDHRYARVVSHDSRRIDFRYTVSDGAREASTSVTVHPRGQVQNNPPVVGDDEVTVHGGGVVRVPVLANDTDPDGDQLVLVHQPSDTRSKQVASWISGRMLGIRVPKLPAGAVAAEHVVRYEVADGPVGTRNASRSGTLLVHVRASSTPNPPPKPQAVAGRSVGGQRVVLRLPTAGIDEDGEGVSIRGVGARAPQLGRITEFDAHTFTYEPTADGRVGTDAFSVDTVDSSGKPGVADVRVAVVSAVPADIRPTALHDELRVRPNVRSVGYDVTTNDIDPDGDPFAVRIRGAKGVAKDGVVKVERSDAERVGGVTRAIVEYDLIATGSDDVPAAPALDSATLTVVWDEDAPAYAPVTVDDAVPAYEVAEKGDGEFVDVDVLANDRDVDGAAGSLAVAPVDASSGDVQVPSGSNRLRVRIGEQTRSVQYRVTDADKQVAYGEVLVPGADTLAPGVHPDAPDVELEAGIDRTFDLDPGSWERDGKPVIYARSGADLVAIGAGATVSPAEAGRARFDRAGRKVTLSPSETFEGDAVVTLALRDKGGCQCAVRLGVPVHVTMPEGRNAKQRENRAPRFVAASHELEFEEGGDHASQSVELALVDDDGDEVRLDGVDAKGAAIASAEARGHAVVVSVDPDAKAGDGGTVVVRAVDVPPRGVEPKHAPANATIVVRVVESTVPKVQVPSQSVSLSSEKRSATVDVLQGVSNRWPGGELSVADVGSGGPGLTVSRSGTRSITVSLSGDAGPDSYVVPFTVQDGSGIAARDVRASLSVSVTRVPGRPEHVEGAPNDAGTSILLRWDAPATGSSGIVRYEVDSEPRGSGCDPGADTSCTATVDPKQKRYRFSVRAVNSQGDAGPPATSDWIDVEQMPGKPENVIVTSPPTKRNQELRVEWDPPTKRGSGITGYRVRTLGSAGKVVTAGPKALSATIGGLTNGDRYQFQVGAVGVNGGVEWSHPSRAAIPYGKPLKVAGVKLETVDAPGFGNDGARLRATWNPADDNGDEIKRYEVTLYKEDSPSSVSPDGETSATVSVENGARYQVSVVAINNAGASEQSARSATVEPYDRAAAPDVTFVQPKQRNKATIRIAQPDLGGGNLVRYVIGGYGSQTSVSNTGPYTFDVSAGSHTVYVYAETSVTSAHMIVAGDRREVSIEAFGDLGTPTITITEQPTATETGPNRTLSFTINVDANHGAAPDVTWETSGGHAGDGGGTSGTISNLPNLATSVVITATASRTPESVTGQKTATFPAYDPLAIEPGFRLFAPFRRSPYRPHTPDPKAVEP